MRIKFLTDIEDHIIKSELTSEMDGKVFHPDRYFMENIRCVEN